MPTFFLCGDVMTGRGIDQILRHPGSPELREGYLRDAREYVRLAEDCSGRVPRAVDPAYLWGEALGELGTADARVVNLETSVTAGGEFDPHKGIHYRMHPANLEALSCARLDVCVLSNNHVLDFGTQGLRDTLAHLHACGLATCGAGQDLAEAERPARAAGFEVLGLCVDSSGVPPSWAAGPHRPGVWRTELSDTGWRALLPRIEERLGTGAQVIISIHWGSNWGHAIDEEQVRFAHRLIDAGVALVHGHSSHHPRALERYRDRLVLYGCGDFIDDYEGIGGYEEFGPDLRPGYFVDLDGNGALRSLRIVPFRSQRLSLLHASADDARWLAEELTRVSARFQTRLAASGRDVLLL